jgi:hypothetical protein
MSRMPSAGRLLNQANTPQIKEEANHHTAAYFALAPLCAQRIVPIVPIVRANQSRCERSMFMNSKANSFIPALSLGRTSCETGLGAATATSPDYVWEHSW